MKDKYGIHVPHQNKPRLSDAIRAINRWDYKLDWVQAFALMFLAFVGGIGVGFSLFCVLQ